jgi:hypothetical protein
MDRSQVLPVRTIARRGAISAAGALWIVWLWVGSLGAQTQHQTRNGVRPSKGTQSTTASRTALARRMADVSPTLGTTRPEGARWPSFEVVRGLSNVALPTRAAPAVRQRSTR